MHHNRSSKHVPESELTEFASGFGRWWNRYGNTALLLVLLASAAFLAKRWYDHRAAAAHEEAWSELAGSTSPDSYRQVAESTDDPTVRALAYLRGADLLLTKATTSSAASDADSTSSRDRALHDAAAMYQRVIDEQNIHKVYGLNARLGLAAVAEARGDWAQARENYQAVLQGAGEGYSSIAAQAKGKLATLDRLASPVVLAAPPPASTPPTQPSILLPQTEESPLAPIELLDPTLLAPSQIEPPLDSFTPEEPPEEPAEP